MSSKPYPVDDGGSDGGLRRAAGRPPRVTITVSPASTRAKWVANSARRSRIPIDWRGRASRLAG